MSMIGKTEFFLLLEGVFPGGSSGWKNGEEADLSALARYLIECVRLKQTEKFEELFSVVERGVIEGSPEVQRLLIVDLLENLKNFSSWEDLDYEIFEPWLGPETHIAWRWLEKKWLGKGSLADAVRKKLGES
jgi:hypothetical protein